jgi:hypothetical protein
MRRRICRCRGLGLKMAHHIIKASPAEQDAYDRLEYLPSVGDRVMPTRGPFVVTERWIGPDASAWNIVLCKAETPSGNVPPWKRAPE